MVCYYDTQLNPSKHLRHIQTSVRKVLKWFCDLSAPRRVEFVCGILQLSTPPELRFYGSCLEEIARHDYESLFDAEVQANAPINSYGVLTLYNTLPLKPDVTTMNKSFSSIIPPSFLMLNTSPILRAKLILSLSLLKSTNIPGATCYFEALMADDVDYNEYDAYLLTDVKPSSTAVNWLKSKWKSSKSVCISPSDDSDIDDDDVDSNDDGDNSNNNNDNNDDYDLSAVEDALKTISPQVLEEIMLIYTLAAFHPAFSFSQRQRLYNRLSLIRALYDYSTKVLMPQHTNQCGNLNQSTHVSNNNNNTTCRKLSSESQSSLSNLKQYCSVTKSSVPVDSVAKHVSSSGDRRSSIQDDTGGNPCTGRAGCGILLCHSPKCHYSASVVEQRHRLRRHSLPSDCLLLLPPPPPPIGGNEGQVGENSNKIQSTENQIPLVIDSSKTDALDVASITTGAQTDSSPMDNRPPDESIELSSSGQRNPPPFNSSSNDKVANTRSNSSSRRNFDDGFVMNAQNCRDGNDDNTSNNIYPKTARSLSCREYSSNSSSGCGGGGGAGEEEKAGDDDVENNNTVDFPDSNYLKEVHLWLNNPDRSVVIPSGDRHSYIPSSNTLPTKSSSISLCALSNHTSMSSVLSSSNSQSTSKLHIAQESGNCKQPREEEKEQQQHQPPPPPQQQKQPSQQQQQQKRKRRKKANCSNQVLTNSSGGVAGVSGGDIVAGSGGGGGTSNSNNRLDSSDDCQSSLGESCTNTTDTLTASDGPSVYKNLLRSSVDSVTSVPSANPSSSSVTDPIYSESLCSSSSTPHNNNNTNNNRRINPTGSDSLFSFPSEKCTKTITEYCRLVPKRHSSGSSPISTPPSEESSSDTTALKAPSPEYWTLKNSSRYTHGIWNNNNINNHNSNHNSNHNNNNTAYHDLHNRHTFQPGANNYHHQYSQTKIIPASSSSSINRQSNKLSNNCSMTMAAAASSSSHSTNVVRPVTASSERKSQFTLDDFPSLSSLRSVVVSAESSSVVSTKHNNNNKVVHTNNSQNNSSTISISSSIHGVDRNSNAINNIIATSIPLSSSGELSAASLPLGKCFNNHQSNLKESKDATFQLKNNLDASDGDTAPPSTTAAKQTSLNPRDEVLLNNNSQLISAATHSGTINDMPGISRLVNTSATGNTNNNNNFTVSPPHYWISPHGPIPILPSALYPPSYLLPSSPIVLDNSQSVHRLPMIYQWAVHPCSSSTNTTTTNTTIATNPTSNNSNHSNHVGASLIPYLPSCVSIVTTSAAASAMHNNVGIKSEKGKPIEHVGGAFSQESSDEEEEEEAEVKKVSKNTVCPVSTSSSGNSGELSIVSSISTSTSTAVELLHSITTTTTATSMSSTIDLCTQPCILLLPSSSSSVSTSSCSTPISVIVSSAAATASAIYSTVPQSTFDKSTNLTTSSLSKPSSGIKMTSSASSSSVSLVPTTPLTACSGNSWSTNKINNNTTSDSSSNHSNNAPVKRLNDELDLAVVNKTQGGKTTKHSSFTRPVSSLSTPSIICMTTTSDIVAPSIVGTTTATTTMATKMVMTTTTTSTTAAVFLPTSNVTILSRNHSSNNLSSQLSNHCNQNGVSTAVGGGDRPKDPGVVNSVANDESSTPFTTATATVKPGLALSANNETPCHPTWFYPRFPARSDSVNTLTCSSNHNNSSNGPTQQRVYPTRGYSPMIFNHTGSLPRGYIQPQIANTFYYAAQPSGLTLIPTAPPSVSGSHQSSYITSVHNNNNNNNPNVHFQHPPPIYGFIPNVPTSSGVSLVDIGGYIGLTPVSSVASLSTSNSPKSNICGGGTLMIDPMSTTSSTTTTGAAAATATILPNGLFQLQSVPLVPNFILHPPVHPNFPPPASNLTNGTNCCNNNNNSTNIPDIMSISSRSNMNGPRILSCYNCGQLGHKANTCPSRWSSQPIIENVFSLNCAPRK
ncbi:unnamed protein product [Trichobilharzia szidati]|nr:unnamed protein product [Trichobilharzia szidati]